MPLAPGDVVRVWDRQIRPPKQKRLICIAPDKQLFLRINSDPKFAPNHLLSAAESDFLDHDSYVELRQLIRPYAYEIQQAEKLGRLTRRQAMSLVEAVNEAKTLPQDHKNLVAERLTPI